MYQRLLSTYQFSIQKEVKYKRQLEVNIKKLQLFSALDIWLDVC